MTAGQLRAARALIRWTAQELADASSVGVATIRRAELKDGPIGMTAPNIAAIKRAFGEMNVEFTAENGRGAGVRLGKTNS
ncbi:transcriptional regulator [Lichenicola cladoniae]|uniref:Transcriptional regulator n=1 Tax=Lichenicola cladoniae TaxID=1484109 RepID=A0A6M8HPJ1_9PROT|nr:transcriptional regulator [Lichenicola cladoniae]NPD68308.1 transcriptional regulator [Acetobacteraceae bacterium]QKE90185.1 transcriptional regulator [Lichenicola cladoniae]